MEVRVKKKRFTEEQIAYALAQESTGQTIDLPPLLSPRFTQ